MSHKKIFIAASLFALTAVMLGAFATHGLRSSLTPVQIGTFETGVHYQFMHAIGLFVIGLLMQHNASKLLNYAGLLMTIGVFLFSGSLFLLSSRSVLGIESWKWLGPITPLGGLSFMAAWFLVLMAVWRKYPLPRQ